ncbi:hypothetical protein MGL_3827 [Malassezia globosa CBS 7966]|uniref:Uncharacterized protein n=1 Tax=Malassezia globosa (strain ATCC MYA-4612 / CBS 7966) TaxID=425265 RepID=A8QAT6_MALGO|nr:uncharacterized protein MGL_3827 [Malassezia globosa CBS 7966]EDP41825.1 hypothetical protein MGL_3827 [Malassezia globosa CBS 7966]
MFFGERVASRLLISPWPSHYWIDLPLVPFMLIASRLPIFANFSTWIPTLALMPLTGSINTSPMRPVFNRYPARAMFSNGYPPDPFMTALLLPWLHCLFRHCVSHWYPT